MELENRIKILRKEHLGLSQTEFGQSLGVTRNVINNIELGRLANPTNREPVFRLICEKYNVREEWLRNGEEPIFDDGAREEQIFERLGETFGGNEAYIKRFAAALAKLDAKDWEDIARIAQKLKEGAD